MLKKRGLHELYADDPEKADEAVWGRKTDKLSRRGFVNGAGLAAMTAVHGANICMWLKRDLRYDPVKERFIDDDEANRHLARAMREPYTY